MTNHAYEPPTAENAADHYAPVIATEVASGIVFYSHGRNFFGVACSGPYIGGWEEGYPSTEREC